MRVKSEVAQPCPTCSDPMDCSPPGSSIHGILQARVLECSTIAFSERWGYFVTKEQNIVSWREGRVVDGRVVVSTSGNFKLSNVVMIVS